MRALPHPPLIVAVTEVAVNAGQMTESNASILVAAGAITVLVLPLTASLLGSKPELKPVERVP